MKTTRVYYSGQKSTLLQSAPHGFLHTVEKWNNLDCQCVHKWAIFEGQKPPGLIPEKTQGLNKKTQGPDEKTQGHNKKNSGFWISC